MTEKIIDNKEYWEKYYAQCREPFRPSLFAEHILKYIQPQKKLIELGCGNGRDSVFLAKKGLYVTAVDQCVKEVRYLSEKHGSENISFFAADFTALADEEFYDYVYSRFTLHAVSTDGQASVFDWLSRNLAKDGYFFLEVRGRKNELNGLGQAVEGEPHAFIYNDHYRRFLDLTELLLVLEDMGFDVIEGVESKGFSPFEGTDETFIRVIAQRK
jgi:tellurite methyltransferase